MKIKYIGALRDFSGYGEAGRHDVAALLTAGVSLTTEPLNFTLETADYGVLGESIRPFEKRELDYDTVIMHVTPNIYGRYHEDGKHHIGRVFWETDKLPADFAKAIEKYCDEVWTGSEFNKKAIEKAGVTKPIYIIPQAIDTSIKKDSYPAYITEPAQKKLFTFYSIFEWTERKNPTALLEAYWSEFTEHDKVALVLKTYVDNFTRAKRGEIDNAINLLKAKMGLSYYAPVYLYRNLMDRYGMYRFHNSFDCFVSAHRGEGWGIPQMEALLMEKPIISTNCGGIHEYLTHDKHAFLPGYTLIPLWGNTRNQMWYTSDQQWCEIDREMLRQAMRSVYELPGKAQQMAQRGSDHIKKTLSLEAVGKIMKDRLYAIHENHMPVTAQAQTI